MSPQDKRKLEKICNILLGVFPKPKTELNYFNEFTLLVAIILSAQTTDKSVNIATKKLFEKASAPSDMIKIGIEKLKEHIKTLNFYNNKAKYIISLSQILLEAYNGEIPTKFEELILLPGVGRKTANVFLNIAHSCPTIAVDTHVFRTTNRIFNKNFKKPKEVEEFLLSLNLHKLAMYTHHLLILHGRYTCVARKPKCETCQISHLCLWWKKRCLLTSSKLP